ncbi:MAG: Hydroxymethylpyrimidine/phosphomethylpyrimidine kinase [Desulfovibrio sp.]
MQKPAVIMTIAGSDSGGGAGIQADVKTMTVLGAFGISAITALTAQNGAGVTGIHAPDPAFMRTQLETLLEGFPIAAAKTGMLFSAPLMEVIADCLKDKRFPLVVDPVAVSQSGHKLLMDEAVAALIEMILPLADVLTPNAPEAEALSGKKLRVVKDIAVIAEDLMRKGARTVLLKGGHFAPEDMPQNGIMTDWLCLPGREPKPLSHKLINTNNNHGTGCTLSAALATFMGQGKALEEAVVLAQKYLVAGLESSFTPGIGCGPPNFLAGAQAL